MNLLPLVRRLFAPAAHPGRIGAEIELIPVTAEAAPQPVDPAVLVAAFDDTFARDARTSFEPGGQLELSPPPGRLQPFLAGLDRLLDRATAAADRCGVRLEARRHQPLPFLRRRAPANADARATARCRTSSTGSGRTAAG